MQRYFIYLAYNGAAYHGWQVQPNAITVQECLERALALLLRQPTPIVGAGRTDSGVHARLMVAHFDAPQPLDVALFADKLNRMLPPDIAIYRLRAVTPDAHARFDATYRTYHYHITTQKDPFLRELTCRHHTPLDIEQMNRAAQLLFDYTDFTSFSKLHTDVKTNNCRIMQAQWSIDANGHYLFVVQADRFLRNMVRAIVGTLVEVGRGKLSLEGFARIIEQKDRCKAGTSMPAHALYLQDIGYPEQLFI